MLFQAFEMLFLVQGLLLFMGMVDFKSQAKGRAAFFILGLVWGFIMSSMGLFWSPEMLGEGLAWADPAGASTNTSANTRDRPQAVGGRTGVNSTPQSAQPNGNTNQQGSYQSLNELPYTGEGYRPCEHDCVQKKARENLSFDSLYTLNLLIALDEKVSSGKSKDLNEVYSSIHRYCLADEKPGNSGGIKECYKRFRKAQLLGLKRKRYGILKAGNHIEELKSDGPSFARFTQEEYEKLQPQYPHVLTLDSIRNDLEQGNGLNSTIISQGYQRWVEGIPKEPEKTDFVKFETIEMNPEDPDNPEPRIVVKMTKDAQGREVPEYDEEAYQAALKKYFEEIGAYSAHGSGMSTSLEDFNTLVSNQQISDDYAELAGQTSPLLQSLSASKPDDLTEVQEEAFTKARDQMVRVANEAIQGKGSASQVAMNPNSQGLSNSDLAQAVLAVGGKNHAPVDSGTQSNSKGSAQPQDGHLKDVRKLAAAKASEGDGVTLQKQADVLAGSSGEPEVIIPLPGSASRDHFLQFDPRTLGEHVDALENSAP